jgi:hypothetical protein
VLGNRAGAAVRDNFYESDDWDERRFQTDIRNRLRSEPKLASGLEEHENAAGGETDLTYHGMPIELKVEKRGSPHPDSCDGFSPQITAYMVAKERRLGILCVLDATKKSTAAFPAEDGITVKTFVQGKSLHAICLVFIQGNLGLPSRL